MLCEQYGDPAVLFAGGLGNRDMVEMATAVEAPSLPGGVTIRPSRSNPSTHQQAENLVLVLKYGSLPVRLISQRGHHDFVGAAAIPMTSP
jgi:preprotein translocase subunit SecD